jgi:hypothetical protein
MTDAALSLARRSPRIGRLQGTEVAQVRGVLAERVAVSTKLDPYMPLKALASYTGLSTRTLRQYINLPPDEALPCYRLPGGGKLLVRMSDFDQWATQFRARGRPGLIRAIRQLGLSPENFA